MRIITLSGKSGSSKSTIERRLEQLGFKRLISYTTREKRVEEEQDKDYHFVNEDTFNRLFDKGYIIEKARYANNLYGLEQPIGSRDYVAVVETDGVNSLRKIYGKQVISIFLDIDTETAINRRNNRSKLSEEDNKLRSIDDQNKFNDIYNNFDIVIDVSDKDVNETVCLILEKIREIK